MPGHDRRGEGFKGLMALVVGPPLGVSVSIFFGAVFLAYGVILPYFPVWLDSRGLTPVEIAAITSAPLFARVAFTPAVGYLADRIGNYRRVIIVLCWSAIALAIALSMLFGFWPLLIIGVAFLLSVGTTLPLIETVAVSAVRTAGLDYGRMRLWGSVTFIVANFLGGVVIEALGGSFGIWMIASTVALTVVAAHLLQGPAPGEVSPTPPGLNWRSSYPVRLLRERLFVIFLVAIGCIHGAHATFYTFGALHWQAQGLSAAWIGALWAISVTAEVVLFAFSAPIVRRFSPAQLIVAGAAAAIVRWTMMVFDPPLALLVPLQMLHAFTYGAAHLGAILFITRAVPAAGVGSAQALCAVVAGGVVLGIVGLISGVLYERMQGDVFILPAGVALIGLAAGTALLNGWGGGLLWPQEPEDAVSPTAPARAE